MQQQKASKTKQTTIKKIMIKFDIKKLKSNIYG
jgi:hypothetical protein